jgi:hypothetical protein
MKINAEVAESREDRRGSHAIRIRESKLVACLCGLCDSL